MKRDPCIQCRKQLPRGFAVFCSMRCAKKFGAEYVAAKQTTLEKERARFEAWFKIAYPIFDRTGRDTTIKHQLWTAWQVAALRQDDGTEKR